MDKKSDLLLRVLEEHPLPLIDLKLTRMAQFLEKIGSPHTKLPPVIHVAGTNGKGSLIANIRAMLEAHGKTVHVYTSPHLVHFHERMVVAGHVISEDALVDILQEVVNETRDFPLTYFEATTAAAFLMFSRVQADFLLLETGLGGRLDATNMIDRPVLTAITPISMDHEKFLGNSLAAIAYEKAGILKSRVPCVVGRQEVEAWTSIMEQAALKTVPLIKEGVAWRVLCGVHDFTYISSDVTWRHLMPALQGRHQMENAALAIACMEQLHRLGLVKLSKRRVINGLTKVIWPARLQRLTRGVLPKMLYKDMELWLDGGHNEGAAVILADWLKQRTRPVHIVMGMMQGRDPKAILRHILPHVASVHAVTIPFQRDPMDAMEIVKAVAAFQRSARSAMSVEEAIRDIVVSGGAGQDILICGSLYLAGSVLSQNS